MHRSQSALEYMMSYGWAILIIVIVAAVLYSFGIFNPSSSVSTTITGFSGLGITTAQCFSNQGLAILFTNNIGQLINLTKINITSGSTSSSLNLSYVVPTGGSSTIFVPTSCSKNGGSHYGVTVSITYMEPDSVFNGPYFSSGAISGTSSAYTLQDAYGWAFGTYSGGGTGPNDPDPDANPGSGVGDSGTSTFGLLITSNFPSVFGDANDLVLNSSNNCGPGDTYEGYTATGTMYFANKTINISGWHDDNEAVFYKLQNQSAWTTAFSAGCCAVTSSLPSVSPGIYNVIIEYLNSCGGGGSSIFIKNAFMEYSQQWSITPWDGGSFSTTLVNGVPSGDTADSSSTSTFTGGWP